MLKMCAGLSNFFDTREKGRTMAHAGLVHVKRMTICSGSHAARLEKLFINAS